VCKIGSGLIQSAISLKRLKIELKLLLTAYIKSYTGFRLPQKYMILNDLCARFKVIYSLNAAKMTKYNLVMTPTPCRVAGGIISLRPTYSCARAFTYLLTYLLTYLHGITTVLCDWPSFQTFQPMICLPFHCLWWVLNNKRTVSIVLYYGVARFALLLHTTCQF